LIFESAERFHPDFGAVQVLKGAMVPATKSAWGSRNNKGTQALFPQGTLPIRVGIQRYWPEKKNRRTGLCDGICQAIK